MPESSALWMILIESSWSGLPQPPNIMAPRQRGLTLRPVRPRVRSSICSPYVETLHDAPGVGGPASDAETALGCLFEEPKGEESFAHDAHALVELSDRDAPWGIGALQDLLDHARDVRGISAFDFVTFHHSDRLLARRFVGIIARRDDLLACCGEVSLEVAGFNERHVNVEGRDLVGQ